MTTENERERAQLEKGPEPATADAPAWLFRGRLTGTAPSGSFQHRGLEPIGPLQEFVDAAHVAAALLEDAGHEAQAERLRAAVKAVAP